MKISGIIYDSIVDGEGIRNTLFVSGCLHKCNGCHNPKTWHFDYGDEFTHEKQMEFIMECQRNILLDGITISGGDPLYSVSDLIPFLKLYKIYNPNHTIWLYTGFTYEEVLSSHTMIPILDLLDVIIDGKYDNELKDSTLTFKGSSNQRIIKLKGD